MRGIVWYKNKNKGEEKFFEIINNYKRLNYKVILKKYSHQIIAYCNNGDFWRLLSVEEGGKGGRTNISLIEKDIKKEIINSIIKPCTILWPFSVIDFY